MDRKMGFATVSSSRESLVMHDMSVYSSAPGEDSAFIIMQLTRTMRAQVRIFTATQLRHSEMNRATKE
jgi:hypothetical protein